MSYQLLHVAKQSDLLLALYPAVSGPDLAGGRPAARAPWASLKSVPGQFTDMPNLRELEFNMYSCRTTRQRCQLKLVLD